MESLLVRYLESLFTLSRQLLNAAALKITELTHAELSIKQQLSGNLTTCSLT